MGQHTLKITITEGEHGATIKLEGRIAGPWAAELGRTWKEKGPALANQKLSLDLRGVTYADAMGTETLREIYNQTGASFIAGDPWTHFLAEQAMSAQPVSEGAFGR